MLWANHQRAHTVEGRPAADDNLQQYPEQVFVINIHIMNANYTSKLEKYCMKVKTNERDFCKDNSCLSYSKKQQL